MWDSMLKPTLVLFLVCVIITGSLAYVNGMTKDVIEESMIAEQESFRKQVMDTADRFEQVQMENAPEGVTAAYKGYKGDELAGFVFEVATKGYGGNISMVVGITSEGKVTKVIIGNNNETPGLGSKAKDPGFISQYEKNQAGDSLTVVKQNKKADNEIQAISGATITSRGVTRGVQAALDMAKILTEGGK